MTTLDTTRQRIREARLRSLVSLSPAAMTLVHADRQIVDANLAATRILGAPREAILVRTVDDFTASGFNVDNIWDRLMSDGRLTGAYPAKRLDGRLNPVLFAATVDVVPGLILSVFTAAGRNGHGAVEPDPANGALTPREREVLRLIADGLTDRQIADALVVAPSTARTHTRNLLDKLDARTRAQAVAIAIRSGELSL